MYPSSHCGDSYALSNFESVHFKPPKQTAGPEFYNRSDVARMRGLVGVGVAALIGFFCIVGGTLIYKSNQSIYCYSVVIPRVSNDTVKEFLSLAHNLVVALCIDAIGLVHGISLRSVLASEKRLRFNTNLRLLSAASGFFNPNGIFFNIIMWILVIASYTSSALVVTWTKRVSSSGSDDTQYDAVCVSEVPLIVLGVALLLQAIIAGAGAWAAWTKILTWSSSPFDLTAALIHHTQITPVSGRCMLSICDDVSLCPVTPSSEQPSAWRAHPSIRKVVWTFWFLLAAYFVWGFIVTYFCDYSTSRDIQSWSFLQKLQYGYYAIFSIPLARTRGVNLNWAFYYLSVAAIQGPLAFVLHCSELVVNLIQDEQMWRKATSKKGTTISSHWLAPIFGSPLNFVFFCAKPLLHSLLTQATPLTGTKDEYYLTTVAVNMLPIHIFIYTAALLIATLIITIIVFRRPKGPQPAAYGHVQTLANLIDEWSPTMWWGDKEGGSPFRHAGTSDHRLPEVDMNAQYA